MSARNFYTLLVTWTVLLPNGESQFRFDRAFASPTIFPRVRFPGGPRENSAQRRECALIIPDRGKQNFRDHNTGTFNSVENAYDGSDVCITYNDVDTAFLRAKNKVGLRTPKGGDVSIHDIGLLGTALQETTRYLAEEYSLSKHDILFGFPQIDTSKTVIGSFCPHFLRRKKCEVKRFREFDGSCNNLQNPHWGSARTPFRRLLQPKYGDGVAAPRLGRESYPLPNPRKVSAHVHRDGQVHDHAVTIMFVAWGQLIDHDLTLTAETKDPITKLEPDCCVTARRHPNCLPIELPPDDEFYQLHKQRCMSILRSQAGSRPGCRLGTRVQFNAITSFIDGSFIYGSSQKVADSLRSLKGGLLKTLPVFRQYGLKDLLPLKLDHPDDGCIRPSKDIFCFLAGDNRANEQLVLAVLHTMFMREHNSIATELSRVNPHWDDERLFQETRHIIAALVQHITFTEFLPMLLGKEAIEKYELLPRAEGYSSGYNPDLDATVTSSFITAAFRFGHSLLPTMVERWSPNNKYIASQRLSEMLRQPFDLYKGGWYDQYMMGLINQVAQAMDDAITNEVTNHLFQKPQKRYGMDLAAINVQRAREHGVPSYNEFRQFCGLPRMYEWNEMMHIMENVTVTRYQDVYRHPDDIDLWSGGVSEKPLPGSLVGPTFNCLIAQNFKNLKYGDRFWYENSGWPSAFTLEQLKEIRKIKLSRLLCNSGDRIEAVQVYAMVLPDYEINPRVPCKSKILPRMDFSKWKELGPQRSFTYVKYPGANYNRKPGVRNPVRFPAPDKSIRLPRPPRLQIPFSWYSRLLFS